MTPAQLKVIEAAKAYWRDADSADSHNNLMDAVEVLESETASGTVESERTWAEVVESDQIWSDKTKKWYPVISSVALPDGRMRIQAKGLPKSIAPAGAGTVRVRRGPTGQAVDMWTVVWSAQTIPSTPTDPDKPESEES